MSNRIQNFVADSLHSSHAWPSGGAVKRADLHCHSNASNEADEAVLNAIACPESFSAPIDVYDQAKRRKIKAILDPLLPGFSVRFGGTTSIDVTRLGIDKGYGIHKLRDVLGIPLTEMLFIGDALYPGGNDRPAKDAGVTSIQVRDPDETKRVVETLVACL